MKAKEVICADVALKLSLNSSLKSEPESATLVSYYKGSLPVSSAPQQLPSKSVLHKICAS